MIRLITGYAGVGHVTSADAGRFNAGICGNDAYIMQTGEQMAYTLNSNNEITIGSGDLVNQGRHFSIPQNSSESLMIENGAQGKARYDAVVVRYSKDTGTGVESASMYIARGTEVASTVVPPKPEVARGNIFAGEIQDDVAIYYIKIQELSITEVQRAVPVIPSLSTIADVIYPIGSIYMSMNSTNPGKLLGGTWEQLDGVFPYATTWKSGQLGGTDHVQISVNNLPSHTHTIPNHAHSIPDHTHKAEIKAAGTHSHTFSKLKTVAAGTAKYTADSTGAVGAAKGSTSSGGSHSHSIDIAPAELVTNQGGKGNTGATGIAQPLYILPPYITVFMWKRTA